MRAVRLIGLFFLACTACGASTRALPDDVMPLPGSSAAPLPVLATAERPDAGGGRIAELSDSADEPAPRCAARVRRLAADHVVVGRSMLSLLRRERSASMGPRVDPKTQQIDGLLIESLEPGSCLVALGFLPGDVLVSLNGIPIDGVPSLMRAYASVQKDGSALVTLERRGTTLRVLYEIDSR